MADDLRSEDDLGGLEGQHHRTSIRRSGTQPRLADREVPIGHQEQETRVLSPAVHGWLDGDAPEASVRKGDTSRDVEFWKSINSEVDRRRRLRTPAFLESRIMEALPQTAPQLISPWWRREFVITPTTAVSAAVALLTAGAAIAALVATIL